jgi:hypothetical protein
MTSAIKASATRMLTDSELDTVAGGAASVCGGRSNIPCPIFGGDVPLPPPPPPPPPPPTK